MDKIRIRGGRRLQGEIHIGGSKNAALPLMACALLTDEPLVLGNVPRLADIATLSNLLADLGVEIRDVGAGANGSGRTVELRTARIRSTVAPYDLVRKMRASILVLGPLLVRAGHAEVSLPGGCAIGTRPVDLHLDALAQMGAEIELDQGYVKARAPGGLHGARIVFPKVSVGATENLLMAAALAHGETTLVNAAREPEIADLAACLRAMGAEIEGEGTDTIVVRGVERLGGARHRVIPDRIEAGSYAMAAAITDGDLELVNARLEHLEAPLGALREAGLEVSQTNRGVRVRRANGALHGVDVATEPFPGFPTDLQAQVMAVMTRADSPSMITESIFENRFMHVPELVRMGADIAINHATAMVRGGSALLGAPVMATDLRASVSLVLAGLAAEGETVVSRVYHLDRGYESLEGKLRACGAEIERLVEP
jgi:UDP-N-acetylglucosamine 1-carboxyvinyltransferase